MKSAARRAYSPRRLLVLTLLAAAAALYAWKPAEGVGEAATPAPQDVIRLESRLSRLEQRLSTIELSIRGLEQQSRLSVAAPGATGARDPEVGLLWSEVEALRLRLAEVESGRFPAGPVGYSNSSPVGLRGDFLFSVIFS